MPIIKLKNVSKYYNNNGNITVALKKIDLSFERGEIVAITGDSGSGKSTLLNVITGIDTYEDGEMYYEGNETSYFNQNDMDNYRKSKVGFIFQNYNIINSYTVLENVMIPMLINGVDNSEAKKRALEIIDKVGLSHRTNNKGTKLSGGEKQRCVIARALASDCSILACDEPTGNLDSKTGEEIINLIKEIAQDKLVLIVTHNYNQVKNIATRVIKISDGEILEDNFISTNEVKSSENVADEKPIHNLSLGTLFKFAIKNIFSTPKKTIFTFLVLLSISVISLLLIMTVFQYSYNIGYSSYSPYRVFSESHLIVYDKNHEMLDKEVIENSGAEVISYNAFYENTDIRCRFVRGKDSDIMMLSYTHYDFSQQHLYGRKPQNDYEFYLIVPNTKSGLLSAYFYNSSVSMYSLDNDLLSKGKVVGAGLSDEITIGSCIYSYTDLSSIMQANVSVGVNQIDAFYYSEKHSDYVKMTKFHTDKASFITVPSDLASDMDEYDFKVMLDEIYEIDTEIPIIITDEYGEEIIFHCYYKASPVRLKGPYEASIYTSKPSKVKKYLESEGYCVTVTNRMYEEDELATLITFYVLTVLVTISIIALFFITYVILYKVYVSKNKDYTVLRSLGILRSKMKFIVIFETVIMTLFSTIVAFIALLSIYYLSKKEFLTMMKFTSLSTVVISIIVMILFGYMLASKYNKKLFKYSVSTSLKSEVLE